jgi:hypothetical protein
MDSGLLAESIIGPRSARTRWLGPGMTASGQNLHPKPPQTLAFCGA